MTRPRKRTAPPDENPRAAGWSMARRDFTWYWLGQSVSLVGDQITLFVLPTVAIVTFGASSVQVGLLNAIGTAAYPALGLFAGVLMDRVRRRPVMIAADLVRAAAFASIPIAAALGGVHLVHIYLVALVGGVFAVLFDVASQSHLPTLVPSGMLTTANARMEMSTTTALLGGFVLGGVLVQLVGGVGALAVNAVSFLFSILGVSCLRRREPAAARDQRGSSVWSEMRAGLAALWGHPLLRPVTIAAALRNLGMAAVQTALLLFAYRSLNLSPGVTGILFTAGAAASLVGASTSARVLRRLGVGRTLLITSVEGAIWTAAPLALALPAVPTLLVIMVVASVWLPLWNTTVTTLRQSVTPANLLGRVHASARTVNMGTIPVGALLGGLAAELFSSALGRNTGLALTLALAGLVAASGVVVLGCSADLRSLREMPAQLRI